MRCYPPPYTNSALSSNGLAKPAASLENVGGGSPHRKRCDESHLTRLSTSTRAIPASIHPAQNSVFGEPSPLNGGRIPVGGAQASVDGLWSSVGGVQTSVDGLRISVGRVQTSKDGLRTSVGGLQALAEGQQMSVDALQASVDGLLMSVDGLQRSGNRSRKAQDAPFHPARTTHNSFEIRHLQRRDYQWPTISLEPMPTRSFG